MRAPKWSGWTYGDVVTARLGVVSLEVDRDRGIDMHRHRWRWFVHCATSGWRHVIDWGGSDSLAGAQAAALEAARDA